MGDHGEAALGIGAVSRATGIPVSTLRTWERRYGVPKAERTDANQRVYGSKVVEYLRLAARALEEGHRPAQVFAVGEDALRRLIGVAPVEAVPDTVSAEIRTWLDATKALDARALSAGMRAAHGRMGLLRFLEEGASPFLVQVGQAWENGEIQTFHEHFSSEQLRDLLVAWWRPLAEGGEGPPVVCATLPGEQHVLGLHMAAAVVALAGRRVVFVGQDTPLVDLRDGAIQADAAAVFVGVSGSANPASTRSSLVELRRLLPASTALVVGGAGAPVGWSRPDIDVIRRLSEIPDALRRLS